jgi:TetR/AcrR family fatty acid metabolism transcriptional regulator
LTERSIASAETGRPETRKRILDAAVRVFAQRGYHGARVGDVARDAGVAHGLLYHYFSSKEELVQAIFRENWGALVDRFRAVESSDEPAAAKLEGIAKILLRTWRNDPDLVTVMVRDVARSARLQGQVDEVGEAFAIVQRIVEQGQAEGSLREDLDPRLASWVLYGGLEEVLTGWVLGALPDGDVEIARAERTAIEVVLRGLST